MTARPSCCARACAQNEIRKQASDRVRRELLQYVLNITKCVELLGVMTASRVSEKALIVLLRFSSSFARASASCAHEGHRGSQPVRSHEPPSVQAAAMMN